MSQYLRDLVASIHSPYLAVFVASMLPISELRGAIPLGVWGFKLPLINTYLVAVTGNLIPILPLLWLIDPLSRLSQRTSIGKRFFDWIFERTKRRGKVVEKYEELGLMMFVAIPLPVTGAWTGTLAAFLFGVKRRFAFPSITAGVFIAGIIVSVFVSLGWVGALIAGLILIGLVGKLLWDRL